MGEMTQLYYEEKRKREQQDKIIACLLRVIADADFAALNRELSDIRELKREVESLERRIREE